MNFSDFKNPYVRDNLKVNWKKNTADINSAFVEFQTNLEGELLNSSNSLYFKYHLLSYLHPDKGEEKEVLIKFVAATELEGVTLTDIKEKNFTGTVIHYNSEGQPTKTVVYENGIESDIMSNHDINNSSKYAPPNPCNNCYVLIYTTHWVDWYNGSTGNYTHSQYSYTSSEWAYVGGGHNYQIPDNQEPYHNHYDYPHGPSMPVDVDNHVVEILKDSSFIGTKAECVYEKLNVGSTTFKELIERFDGEFPVAHLKFKIDNSLTAKTNAQVSNGYENYIEIRINGNTLPGRTVLGLARTLIHETIHAELYRKVRSVGGNVSIKDFPGIYDYYRRYIKGWQHEQMAAHYRTTIVEALKEFDGNRQSLSFYNDLAWEGLTATVVWQNLPLSEKTRITNFITNYKKNGSKNCI